MFTGADDSGFPEDVFESHGRCHFVQRDFMNAAAEVIFKHDVRGSILLIGHIE